VARKTAEMPPTTVRLMKEAINATAGALHRATGFAGAVITGTTVHCDGGATRAL